MKVKKTMGEVIYFINLVGSLDAFDKEADTKAKKQMESLLRKLDIDVITDYNSDLEDLRVQHCAVDKEKKTILKDEKGNYEFTKEGMSAFLKAAKKLKKNPIEFDLKNEHIQPELFADLQPDILDYLTTFGVFPVLPLSEGK